ncbi:MAG TPA: hypothetical protein VKQ52_12625, partial [Puia sp.]|nr:hypothetical protein [Puia sp.]
VSQHGSQLSRLDEEITFLTDYLEMQKIRFGTALECAIHIPEENLTNRYLLSFSLQPLLENAIKHNELTEETPLRVCVYQSGDRVIVSNNLQKRSVKTFSANHGLANLAERYRLWSGDDIIIAEEENTFSVSIKLLTNEHSHH